MSTLQSLPTELIREMLGHLQPKTALHEYDIPEDARWDIRHWRRTLTAVARTCRCLRDVAVPLLYSRYERAFDNPNVHFIDRSALHHSLRHVAVRTDGSASERYTPTPERIAQYHAWTDVSDWEPYGISDSDTHVAHEVGQIELWRLLSRAPNLESLHVTAHSWLRHNQQGAIDRNPTLPPMWLSPVILAAQKHPSKTPYHGWFRQLHSLTLNLQNKCGTWVVPLFSLPSLQSLFLHSMGRYPLEESTPTQNWPEMTAMSSVRELGFLDVAAPADLIVRMISYCKTLQTFKCDRVVERLARGYKDARQWCTDIVAGLQPHRQTLSSLALFPWDRPSSHRLHIEYKRIPGFQTLVALKHLHVPWHTLMGSPECFQHEQDNTWESLGYWQYPLLRDVVPLNLHTLTTSVSDDALPTDLGIEESLCGGLPPDNWEDDTLLLKRVEFTYHLAHYFKPLPIRFWHVQDAFRKAGCVFSYRYRLDPMDFQWKDLSQGDEHELRTLADTLAKEGHPGVQIALRCGVPGLPRRVMQVLGLGREWLDTEEAREVLFGETFDYGVLNWWEEEKEKEMEKEKEEEEA